MTRVPDRELRQEYRRRLLRFLLRRPEPTMLMFFTIKCAMHYHYQMLIRRMEDPQFRMANIF